ncbi:hypothetical protein JTB14_037578 [Gonioctena quinquepunctata]|nr:hypothetical protein JTB14_037578 [Gonioctena quinquepunctata]
MAEAFLEHYTSIGKKLAEDCKHDPTFSSPQTYMENSIYISETDEVEVGEIIKTLKSKNSPGPDGLRSETLKAIGSYISQPLAFSINIAIRTGKFPTAFKSAVIK